jgi:DNA excision repair protein ERCC-4
MPDTPITIVVDTREKLPWKFTDPGMSTVVRGLPEGDYSVVGFESEIAIERKSMDDYVQTLIRERPRVQRELDRMAPYGLKAIVVEGSVRDIRDHNYRSQAHPNSVFGLTIATIVDHGVPVYFMEDEQIAARFAGRLMRRWVEKHQPKDLE